MRMEGTKIWAAMLLGFGMLVSAPAQAVILGSADGSGNTTAPTDDPGWARIGMVNGSTGVYLGDGYVLSAKHVDAGNFTLGSTIYSLDSSFAPQYLQTLPGMFADLVIFRVVSGPSMSLMPIYTGSAEAGKIATYVGFGLDRGTEVTGQGWLWGTTQTERWGQNVIDGTFTISDSASHTSYESLVSDFDRVGSGGTGLANESAAATGDSGGALFIKDGSIWKLAGIMTAVTATGHSYYDNSPTLPGNQPDNLYSVRLSDYSGWILTTIPEPGSWALMVLGSGLLAARLFRKK